MKRMYAILLALGVLVGAALACELPGGGTPPIDPGEVATSVAQTLTAAAGGGETPGSPTDTPAPGVTPTEAPAVLKVVYVDGGNVWLWTEGGGATQLTSTQPAEDVRISDDGAVVAFTSVDGGGTFHGLWAVDADGTNLRQLVTAAEFDALKTDPGSLGARPFQWEFAPGTHTVAFNTHLLYDGPGLQIQDDVRLVDADAPPLTTLLAPGDGGTFAYSPDGSEIAISTPTDISLVNADGSNRRDAVVTYTAVITYSEYQYYARPRWAPDGSYLRVAIPSADILAPDASISVWHIPADGSPASSLATIPAMPLLTIQESIVSPDASKLAYLVQVGTPTDNNRELHIVNADGTGDTLYHTAQLAFKVWAPDSTKFVFDQGGEFQLGQVGAAFGPLADVPNAQGQVRWVDADTVLFTAGSFASWELRLRTLGAPSVVVVSTSSDFVNFDFDN